MSNNSNLYVHQHLFGYKMDENCGMKNPPCGWNVEKKLKISKNKNKTLAMAIVSNWCEKCPLSSGFWKIKQK